MSRGCDLPRNGFLSHRPHLHDKGLIPRVDIELPQLCNPQGGGVSHGTPSRLIQRGQAKGSQVFLNVSITGSTLGVHAELGELEAGSGPKVGKVALEIIVDAVNVRAVIGLAAEKGWVGG